MNIAVAIDEVGKTISPDAGEDSPASKRIVVAYGFWIFLLSDVVMFSALFASYAGLARAKTSGIKRVNLGGVACVPQSIKSLRYPLSRFVWLVLPTASADPDVLQAVRRWESKFSALVDVPIGRASRQILRTEERTLPGFRHDVCSAIHPLGILSPFLASVPLAKRTNSRAALTS